MIDVLAALARRAGRTTLTQAVRVIEQVARLDKANGDARRIGVDSPVHEEPLHFVASERMMIPTGDLAAIQQSDGSQPVVVANVLGLVGATPALPATYSELQLQRRRLRDRSMSDFYNLFDHRALSFFYRASAKHKWTLAIEQPVGAADTDPITNVLLAVAGLPDPALRRRLAFDDTLLAPLAGEAADTRRSARSVEAMLRKITGLPLRVIEAEPRWAAIVVEEQTRIGRPGIARFAQLGGEDLAGPDDPPAAAMIGEAVLDAQHHYVVEVAPLSYSKLLSIATDGKALTEFADACRFAAGIVNKPLLRLGIAAADVRPMILGSAAAPACLGRTSWLGMPPTQEGLLTDCTIVITTH
jgi:type VI secretion system protein ImpH